MKRLVTQAMCCCLLYISANAWSYEAHHVIAGIAQCILTDSAPEVLPKVESILSALNNEQTAHERDHRFVESAIFADLIKTMGG